LIRLGKLDDAENELNRALSLAGSSSSVVYRYLGALYSERGEKSKAVEALKKYLKLTPGAKDAAQVQAIINQLQEPSVSKD
jgi:tetratricopeptide (TPR) repeat protein